MREGLRGLSALLVSVVAVIDLDDGMTRDHRRGIRGLRAIDGCLEGVTATLLADGAINGDKVTGRGRGKALVDDVLKRGASTHHAIRAVDVDAINGRVEVEIGPASAKNGKNEKDDDDRRHAAAALARGARNALAGGVLVATSVTGARSNLLMAHLDRARGGAGSIGIVFV